jgi:hypothetical protein
MLGFVIMVNGEVERGWFGSEMAPVVSLMSESTDSDRRRWGSRKTNPLTGTETVAPSR